MENRWLKLEEIVRRVVREELSSLKKKPAIEFVAGRFVGITEDQMRSFLEAYPAVDVDGELKRAAAWLVNNPKNAPRSNIGRFLNAWLSKSQSQAAIRSIPSRAAYVPPSLCAYCLAPSTGSVSGIRHCRDHLRAAIDGEPLPKTPGVEPKRVAGE